MMNEILIDANIWGATSYNLRIHFVTEVHIKSRAECNCDYVQVVYFTVHVVKENLAEVDYGEHYCDYYYCGVPVGCVSMIYADISAEERPPEAGGCLLTSSTTKLSSLLSASLPCERGAKVRLDIPTLLSDFLRVQVPCYVLFRLLYMVYDTLRKLQRLNEIQWTVKFH